MSEGNGGKGGKGASGRPIGGQGAPSIFASADDSVVAGELLLKLTSEAVASITTSVPTGPLRGTADMAPSGFGVDRVDAILTDVGAYAVTRLHPPMPPTMAMSAEATALGSTYRVFIDPAQDPAAVAARLQELAEVEDASVNRWRETYVTPNDPDFPQQWGLAKINCPAAWDRTTGSNSITVAVVDTGIDLDHPELAPLLVPGRDLVDMPGASAPSGFHFEGDFVGRDDVPQDEVGHGTHVAGTIACSSNNGTGVAGVTWSCRLMPVRVLARIVNNADASDVRGSGSAADIAAGIRWAVDHGARVINMSLGGPSDVTVERDAVAYAIANNVVVVAAMGNSFREGDPTSYPGAYPGVIAVGATTQSDTRAPFSDTGPHIDVAAPGVDIRSTVWNDGYTNLSGTSMASPHVAGVAALVLSCNPGQTAAQVGDILRGTARALREKPGDPVPNNQFGFGLVDAAAAVNRACPPVVSRQLICQPSAVIACRPSVICVISRQVSCQASRQIVCQVTMPVRCVSAGIVCTPATTSVSCVQITRTVVCVAVTRDIRCEVTGGLACRPRIPDPGQGQQGGQDLYDYDPYGAMGGEGQVQGGAVGQGGGAQGPVQPSVTVLCQAVPSLNVVCQVSHNLACRPSVLILCAPSVHFVCQPTHVVVCRLSSLVFCPPPSSPVVCGGIPGGPQVPGGPGPVESAGVDPYGSDPYGYDPYGEWGVEEGDSGGY